MGVTDEDAKMDLDLYNGNFDLMSIAEPDLEKHNVSQKQAGATAMLTRGNISPYWYNNLSV